MSTVTDTTTTTTTLAAPLTLPNGASIKNRLVKAAMSEQLAGPANQPTAELARVYRRWAHGGAGLIITGNVMIDRRSLGEPLNVVVEDDRDIEPLQHWAVAAKSAGATALIQINHPGPRPSPASPNWPSPRAPSKSTWAPRSPSRAP
jgi:2,4-dienoyl-CoA reductase-like NADH-dependent reductase (Old Yellow Enzyme family)